jgi:hypothetical protein
MTLVFVCFVIYQSVTTDIMNSMSATAMFNCVALSICFAISGISGILEFKENMKTEAQKFVEEMDKP